MHIQTRIFQVKITIINGETFIHAYFMCITMSSLRDFSIPEAYEIIREKDRLSLKAPIFLFFCMARCNLIPYLCIFHSIMHNLSSIQIRNCLIS